MDYEEIFRNRTVIITGVGRSGTTILGKLVGSLKDTVYLFEPAILKLFNFKENPEILRGIIFEDYILPIVQGRVNENENDWSWYGHYFTESELLERRKNLSRRKDAIQWIKDNDVKFVIKTNECQDDIEYLKRVFRHPKSINIIRNGVDVVNSMTRMGWYTDEYCKDALWLPRWLYMENQLNRCAYAWAEYVLRNDHEFTKFIRYEDLQKNPEQITTFLSMLVDKPITELTKKHIGSVDNSRRARFTNGLPISITDLKTLFINKMELLGYDM